MFSKAYKRYALGLMTLVCALNLADRGVMIMLIEPIKEDLALSDTQMGFLTGIAFGLFYATFGVPIARWADRGNRVTIASLAIGFWGATVMACLFIGNYFQLVCARIAAAIGEAGGGPPTYSLLADYFKKPAERMRAMYVYQAASPLATMASFALAGWLSAKHGWRMTFFLIGIPGLLVALITKFTLAEPREHRATASPARAPPVRDILRLLWDRRSCRHLAFSTIVLLTMTLGLGPWYAAFMLRSHHMPIQELGVWLGVSFGVSGIAGLIVGNGVVSRWLATSEIRQIRAAAVAIGLSTPLLICFLTIPNKYLAIAMLLPQIVLLCAALPVLAVLLQRLVPDNIRATANAMVLLLANLIGMGIGPQLVGVASDILRPALGNDSLRCAMLGVSFLAVWAAAHLWRTASTIRKDLLGAEGDAADSKSLGVDCDRSGGDEKAPMRLPGAEASS